jgi:phosphoribosylanthranilate isomerase
MVPRVKICCIASLDEARRAVAAGASALGLVGRMPSGPGPIDDATIAAIARAAPPAVATFLLSAETASEALIDQARRLAPSALQLVDAVAGPAVYAALRRACPALKLVQVIHVRGAASVDEARAAAAHVDALLLDSGNPDAAVPELGGTGRTHDWAVSRRIVDAVAVPVFLAGGLNAANVGAAIRAVRPFGVDVCSGLRPAGALDDARLAAFMAAIRAAA